MTVLISGTELAERLEEAIGGCVDGSDEFQVWVKPEQLIEICRFLKETPNLAFDFLSSVTAVDYVEHFELVYHLTSMGFNHRTILKARVFGRLAPEVPSIASSSDQLPNSPPTGQCKGLLVPLHLQPKDPVRPPRFARSDWNRIRHFRYRKSGGQIPCPFVKDQNVLAGGPP